MQEETHASPAIEGAALRYRYKYSIVACARWEERDILEWVEYHRGIGFDHIYLYSNDDDPMQTFRVLIPYLFGPRPFVTFKHFPKRNPSRPQQQDIYLSFLRNHKHETEWFSFIDIDEFFVFKNVNNVKQFMKPFENGYDSVYFNWLIFGNNGKLERDGDSILLSYTKRCKNIDFHTKAITRSAKIPEDVIRIKYSKGARGFWHFWNDYDLTDFRITNVLSDNIDQYTEDFPKWAHDYVHRPGVSAAMIRKAYIAHFQIKSEEDYMRRVRRGGTSVLPYWQKTFESGNYKRQLVARNEVWDAYLARYWLRRAANAFDFVTEFPVPVPSHPNIALRKPTSQSSIARKTDNDPEYSAVQGHANDGIRTGGFGFATEYEDKPWWMVDFLDTYVIDEIHIYNRVDLPEAADRSRYLRVEASLNGKEWGEVFVLDGMSAFGGVGSIPLVIKPEKQISGRYLRISSWKPCSLHLDEIEVYGHPPV
jgi:hypothetical protein